jgi:hypothetical protein
VVALEEYRSSSLAAGQRRRKSAGASLTSTPKNRVWGFANTPSGRPCANLDLSWETAIGSVQYTYKIASGRAEFLTRDPLGFKAGPNMYCYVRQNPWTYFDPEGLQTQETPSSPSSTSPKSTLPHVSAPTPAATAQTTAGFAQKSADSCMPTATRQVIYGATGKDPGDMRKEVAQAAKDPKHNWDTKGMFATMDNQKSVMQAHGAQIKEIDFKNAKDLVGKLGTTPAEVYAQWSTGGAHEITIRKDPSDPTGKTFIVTNPSGKVGEGGEEKVTRDQIISGKIPESSKAKSGSPTLTIPSGYPAFTATPLPSPKPVTHPPPPPSTKSP